MKLAILAFTVAALAGCATSIPPTASHGPASPVQPLSWATGTNGMAD